MELNGLVILDKDHKEKGNVIMRKTLDEKANELSNLIQEISNSYIKSDNEYENELFYSGLQKTKEFCADLKTIAMRRKGQ